MRSVNNLQDAGGGLFCCSPEDVCRSVIDEATAQHTPCRYFAQGRCDKGDACPFYHDVASEPLPLNSYGAIKGGSKGSHGGSGKGGGKSGEKGLCAAHNKWRGLAYLTDTGDGTG